MSCQRCVCMNTPKKYKVKFKEDDVEKNKKRLKEIADEKENGKRKGIISVKRKKQDHKLNQNISLQMIILNQKLIGKQLEKMNRNLYQPCQSCHQTKTPIN